MAQSRGRPDGFMRRLRRFLLFKGICRRRQKLRTIFFCNVFANLAERLIGHPGRVRTHISDETDEAFVAEFDAFIKALGDHHCALYAEAQLARRILLQLAGCEWSGGVATALLFVYRTYDPISVLERDANLLGILAVV